MDTTLPNNDQATLMRTDVQVLGIAMLNHWRNVALLLFKGLDGKEHVRISSLNYEKVESEEKLIEHILTSKRTISTDIAKLIIENFGHWYIDPYTTTRLPIEAVFPLLLNDFKDLQVMYAKLQKDYILIRNIEFATRQQAQSKAAELIIINNLYEKNKLENIELKKEIQNLKIDFDYEREVASKWNSWVVGHGPLTNAKKKKNASTKESDEKPISYKQWLNMKEERDKLIKEKNEIQSAFRSLEAEYLKLKVKNEELKKRKNA